MTKIRTQLIALFANDLLKHTAILFAGMMVVNVCNLAYQMIVSRVLPEKEYALLAAFFGLLTIIGYPLSTLSTGLSHYSSLLQQEGRIGDVRRLLRKWFLLTGAPAFVLGTAIILFNGSIASFLHLNRLAPIIIAGALIPAMFWLPILTGTAQGLQLFGWSSMSSILGSLIRLLIGAGFVWFLYPACGWAMLGHGAGIYLSAAVLVLGLFLVLRNGEKTSHPLPSMRFYLLQSFFVQLAFAVLMTADVVLVKHYLPENTEFAYASTLGRMVAWFSMAVAVAMFPKVASSDGATTQHRKIFFQSLGYTGLCVAAAAFGCFLLPRLLLRIVFGMTAASDSLVLLTRLMAAVMAASALLNVVVQFLLAQRRFKDLITVVFCAVLYLASVYFFHKNAQQIATMAGISNALALITGIWIVTRRNSAAGRAVTEND
jgi:O-antigen/teichoic acid export membrane protein